MPAYLPKLTAALWLAGMLIIAALATQVFGKPWLETSFLALLPATEQHPEVAKAVAQHNQLSNKKLIWLTGADTAAQAVVQARQLHQKLLDSGLFQTITLEVDNQNYRKQYQGLFPYRYQLLTPALRQWLFSQPQQLLVENQSLLNSPIGQLYTANLEKDPLLLVSRFFNAQQPLQLDLQENIVVLPERENSWAMVLAELPDDRLDLTKLAQLLNLAETLKTDAQTSGGQLLVSGLPLFTAYGAQSAQQEIATVGVGSSLGIVGLLWLTFRSFRPLLLSTLAIGAGLLVALVIGVLVFGKIHLLTLVFGASLIGVADDYAQHFLCDSLGEKNWQPQKTLAFILPGLSLGLINNLLSYAGLSFSPFPGLQEVAVFSAVGLLGAWLTVVMVFPLLLKGFEFTHRPEILKLSEWWEQRWPGWVFKNRYRLGIGLAGFILGGLYLLVPRDDIRLLQTAEPELFQMAEKIKTLLPVVPDNQFFLVSGANQTEWYAHERQLVVALENLQTQKALRHFAALSRFWPDQQQQTQNYQLLKQQLVKPGLVDRYMNDLGFAKPAIVLEHQEFEQAGQRYLTLEKWLESADPARQSLWLGCADGPCRSRVSLSGIKNVSGFTALAALPGVTWVDQVDDLSKLFSRYRVKAMLLLSGAFGVASLGMILKFGWKNATGIMAVPLLSVAAAMAVLGWLGELFSLFNLFALLLVLGIGVDYGLFFFLAGERRVSTSLGVTVSALTTLLAFGLLATSRTEVVHAFGLTLTAGIIMSLLCAPLVGHTQPQPRA